MVKHGPCYHCGIEKTPLWRNGPPEKPVLCNACGSRWRIRGTLEDYVPKHALPSMTIPTRGKTQKSHQHKLPLGKILVSHSNTMVHNESHSDSKEDVVSHGVVHNESHSNSKGDAVSHGDTNSTGFGYNTSHRTSSGSSSISCSDHTHSEPLSPGHCSNYWNANIPSRKRSLVQYHNLAFVEKLQKDLYDILQNEEATSFSECPDGNLIYYENGGNHEIGLGALLLNPPITPVQQESKKFNSEGNNKGDREVL